MIYSIIVRAANFSDGLQLASSLKTNNNSAENLAKNTQPLEPQTVGEMVIINGSLQDEEGAADNYHNGEKHNSVACNTQKIAEITGTNLDNKEENQFNKVLMFTDNNSNASNLKGNEQKKKIDHSKYAAYYKVINPKANYNDRKIHPVSASIHAKYTPNREFKNVHNRLNPMENFLRIANLFLFKPLNGKYYKMSL